jgi:predicted phosphodiesterase
MRIAAVTDIHGNLLALDAVLAEIAAERADIVVNRGDILSGPLWPHETAQRLRALNLPTIAGNHERQVLRQPRDRMGAADRYAADALDEADRAWLESLPPTLALHPEVFCCHGTPSTDLQYLLETAVAGFGADGHPGVRAATGDEVRERLGDVAVPVVLCGHSHMPRLLQSGRTLAVNPGSVGLPAFEDLHGHRHLMETGTPLARWALLERRDAGWHVALRATPYDCERAAARAEANGRGDWADALRTGRIGRPRADGP